MVFAIAILGIGALFLTVGLAVLATLIVAGGFLGMGVGIYRRLRAGIQQLPSDGSPIAHVANQRLDPALEVKPVRPAIVSPKQDGEL
ncbi:MAG: hypothetical protein ABJF01_16720 [bacterium]